MGKAQEKDIKSSDKVSKQRLVKDPRTGHFALTKGKKFTKEDVDKDFPDISDRDSIVIRKSVGL